MSPEELKKSILSVKRWSKGDQRAPNKPLIMIYVLSEYLKGHGQLLNFEHEVEKQVNELLAKFGPSRKSYHSHYGFWRLINDGFWRLDNVQECLPRKSNTDPPKSELIKYKAMGGFSDEAYHLIKNKQNLIIELIEDILSENFPDSIAADIASHLSLEINTTQLRKRDASFRRDVLRAYNYKCAICGYDLRIDDVSFGLEAAHIKWKQFLGPCSTNNGLALCSIHHKAFDIGALSIDSNLRVLVSKKVNGGRVAEEFIYKFEGERIFYTRDMQDRPKDIFISWHRAEVYKK